MSRGCRDCNFPTVPAVLIELGLEFAFALALTFCRTGQALADPQTDTETAQTSDAQTSSDNSDYNGQDYTRPETKLQGRTEFRSSSSATSARDREIELLQYTTRIDLSSEWKLGLLGQLPGEEQRTRQFNTNGSMTNAGLGDVVLQGALIDTIDSTLAYGFGARLTAPTRSSSLGTSQWQIMPGFGVRYSFPNTGSDTYFVPVIRYAMSFGPNPSNRTISEPQIAPTLNLGLPDSWFVTFYPSNDIRINFGTPISGQTGRLFLPFDFAFGKSVTKDLVLLLEVSVPMVKEYPVYDFKSELRVTWKF